MELYTLAEKHDYDFSTEAPARADAPEAGAYLHDDEALTAGFNCAGTAGTFGTAGGCIGTFGSFGCANCIRHTHK